MLQEILTEIKYCGMPVNYTNAVYVTTNRVLLGEERLFVSKEFKVGELRCTFVLQPMVENRKGMCTVRITSDLNE